MQPWRFDSEEKKDSATNFSDWKERYFLNLVNLKKGRGEWKNEEKNNVTKINDMSFHCSC